MRTESGENARSRWSKLPPHRGRCQTHVIQVAPARIGYVNAILEGFGHLARVRTKEQERGVLEIVAPDDAEEVLRGALNEMARRPALGLRFDPSART